MHNEIERRPETASGFAIGNEIGFQYFRSTQERADAAWERIHVVTRWNYAALSAAALLTGVDYDRFGPSQIRIDILCGFVIVAALAAAALAWMQVNYALWLYRCKAPPLEPARSSSTDVVRFRPAFRVLARRSLGRRKSV